MTKAEIRNKVQEKVIAEQTAELIRLNSILDEIVSMVRTTLGSHEPVNSYETGYFDALYKINDFICDGKWP